MDTINPRRNIIMAYVISDDCISCGACAAGCPVESAKVLLIMKSTQMYV